jgi:hypothetical protein
MALCELLCQPHVSGLPAAHCSVVADPKTPTDIAVAVDRAATEAGDLLLIYYAGHGILDDQGLLHLGVTQSTRTYTAYDSFAFESLRPLLAKSAARKRVLILDCCFRPYGLRSVRPRL